MTNALLALFGVTPGPGASVQLWWDAPLLGLSAAGLVLVCLVMGALAWVSVRGGASRWRGGVVVALRVMALALLGVMLLKPAMVLLAPIEGRERLAVLVDASRSMSVAAQKDAPTRFQAAQRALADGGQLAALAKHYDLEVYGFTDHLLPVGDVAALGALTPDGEMTDLGAALHQLVDEGRDLSLGGVVVLSDGIDRGGVRRAWAAAEPDKAPEAADEALGRALKPWDLPIHAVALGSEAGFVDLAIDDLSYSEFAFLRQPSQVTVSVRSLGLAGRRTQVKLSEGGRVLGVLPVELPPNGEVRQVSFPLNPERVGKYTYTVSTPVLAEEAIPGNNTRSFTLKVVRDRIRVLQIVGAPSWDEKFMRRLLKTDPNIDLVSFFILRTALDDRRPFQEHEFSLIEFPHRDLFDKDLHTFDLVIFQNFNYRPYFDTDSYQLLSNLARFVEDGGGLAVLGGEKAFAGGEYAGTPLEDVLPVRSDKSPSAVEREIRFGLTPEGSRHPVTALHFDGRENAGIFSRLPALDGFNPVSLQPGAVVLGKVDGSDLPLLAVRQVGKGRSLAFMTDTSWYWSFEAAGAGQGNGAYLRFWKNALRWLVGDPDEAQVQVDTDRENYRLGQRPVVTARVVGVDYAPLVGARVKMSLVPEAGGEVVSFEGATGDAGAWTQALELAQVGPYRVKVDVVSAGGEPVGAAETVFTINEEGPEMKELGGDRRFLQALTRVSGGRLIEPGEVVDGPLLVKARPDSANTQRTVIPLWDKTPTYAGLFGLLCLEWLLRRRWGFK